MIVAGAYGRSYSSIVSAKEDWDSDKDFRIVGGPYVNRSDWIKYSDDDTVLFESERGGLWVLQEGGVHE